MYKVYSKTKKLYAFNNNSIYNVYNIIYNIKKFKADPHMP